MDVEGASEHRGGGGKQRAKYKNPRIELCWKFVGNVIGNLFAI